MKREMTVGGMKIPCPMALLAGLLILVAGLMPAAADESPESSEDPADGPDETTPGPGEEEGEATPPPDQVLDETGDEIVVTGTRTPHTVSDAPVATSVVDQQEMRSAGAANAGDALETVPGVYVDEYEAAGRGGPGSGINLQGLPTDRILVLIDGQRMPITMRAPDLELIPAPLIDRIEVVKGPSSSLYGSDAIGGVVNIITRRPSNDPEAELLLTGGSFSTFGGNAFHAWRGGPIGWVVNYNREQSDGWIDANAARSLISIGEGVVDTLPFPYDDGHPYETNDLFGKVTADAGSYLTFTAESRFHWEDNQFSDTDDGAVSDDKIQFSGLLRGELQYGRLGVVATGTYFHRSFRYREYSSTYTINPFPPPDYIRGLVNKGNTTLGDDFNGELLVNGILADWNLLSGGIAYRHERLDYEAFEESSFVDSDQAYNAYQTILSFFLQDEIFLFHDIWSLVPGIRHDYHYEWGTRVNPKLSTLVKLPSNTAIRASIGRAFREPMLSQLYRPIFRHTGYFLVGNQDLEPETAVGINAEIEHGLRNLAYFTTGYFHYELEDMIYEDVVDENYRSGFPLMTYVNLKRARINGVESMVSVSPLDWLRITGNYTWTIARDLEEDASLGTSPEHNAGLRLFIDYLPWGTGGFVGAAFQSERDYIGRGGDWYTAEARWSTNARVYKTLGKHVELGFRMDNWLGYDWDREGDGDNDLPPTGYYGELKLTL